MPEAGRALKPINTGKMAAAGRTATGLPLTLVNCALVPPPQLDYTTAIHSRGGQALATFWVAAGHSLFPAAD